jgi:hypothetical protein
MFIDPSHHLTNRSVRRSGTQLDLLSLRIYSAPSNGAGEFFAHAAINISSLRDEI